MTRRSVDSTVTTYRGFVLLITDRDITVRCRRGRQVLTHEKTMSSVRRFIRGYLAEEHRQVSTTANERPWPLTLGRSSAARAEEVTA